MSMGWECPKCHTVHAPSVLKCAACSPTPGLGIHIWPQQQPLKYEPKTGDVCCGRRHANLPCTKGFCPDFKTTVTC